MSPNLKLWLLLALPLGSTLALSCYQRHNSQKASADGMHFCQNAKITSEGAMQCCFKGDQCGTQQLCKDDDGNFYVGGCTDSTYQDPVCRNECSSYPAGYISWNTTLSHWNCCGGDEACNATVTEDSFESVDPGSWTAMKDTVVSSTATPTASSKQSNQRNKFSQGAAIGVGVGATLGALALLAVLGWWAMWWRRKSLRRQWGRQEKLEPEPGTVAEKARLAESSETQSQNGRDLAEDRFRDPTGDLQPDAVHEAGGVMQVRHGGELDGRQNPQELSTNRFTGELPAESRGLRVGELDGNQSAHGLRNPFTGERFEMMRLQRSGTSCT